MPEHIKHQEEAIKRCRELLGLETINYNFVEPVYSFHCPGDFDELTSFINELEDN